MPSAESTPAVPRAGLSVYDGVVRIDPVTRQIHARWRIAFVRVGLNADSARFLLNDGFSVSGVHGRSVLGFTSSKADDHIIVTIPLSPPGRGDTTSVELQYQGTLSLPDDHINDVSPAWVELGLDSFWQPVFPDFESILGRVAMTLRGGFKLVASGEVVQQAESTFVLTMDQSQPDIAFSGSPSFRHVDSGSTRVYYVGIRTPLVSRLLTTTETCSQYLDRLYGQPTPLPPRRIVLAPRVGPGYARKNYIVITQVSDTAPVAVSRFVCHELAHFWSMRANATGPDNWLNEGFAEFVSARFVRSTLGEAAYEKIVAEWQQQGAAQPAVWTPNSTRRPSAGVSYRKAPYLLTQLEARVGQERMQRVLVRYMTEPIRTTPELLAVIGDVAGIDTAKWFGDLLGR